MPETTLKYGLNDPLPSLWQNIADSAVAPEASVVNQLIESSNIGEQTRHDISQRAERMIRSIRADPESRSLLDKFLGEYSLGSEEGVILMCLAEALLRIPDNETRDRLIQDKLAHSDWLSHLGHSDSLLVNASTFGLMLSGRLLDAQQQPNDISGWLHHLISRLGEPIVREATLYAMQILGDQFVLGQTIESALKRASLNMVNGYRYSFDMLGEAALTGEDAEKYFSAYEQALKTLASTNHHQDVIDSPGISIKLTALHPRFEATRQEQVVQELLPKLVQLAIIARRSNLNMAIDAEECDRLELTLTLFEKLFSDPQLADWEGLGIAVQAYQKSALPVLNWLGAVSTRQNKRIMLRLVKGAYWDSEIKLAQERGLDDYPVFTRKVNTDVSYLACAQFLLNQHEHFYPQFATHNAHTLCAVQTLAGEKDYELQRLHGMGDDLYAQLVEDRQLVVPVRIYAPVGSHDTLLPYLVRRLLENGANSSFVNRLHDAHVPATQLAADPFATANSMQPTHHPDIPLPGKLFLPDRKNSKGLDLSRGSVREKLLNDLKAFNKRQWKACPIIGGEALEDDVSEIITSPADFDDKVGGFVPAAPEHVNKAVKSAAESFDSWASTAVETRASILENLADGLEKNRIEWISLMNREAGKTIVDAISEVREAVDFCRYYAHQARRLFTEPIQLPGITGEENRLSLHARGVFVCISPWNFPMAIFTGQIAAALAAGNTVIAKPAGATPLIAYRIIEHFHEAGIPGNALHFLPGSGKDIGELLTTNPAVSGIAFTGSVETAQTINRNLANHKGPIASLIAETGGINAMIADSTALPEQIVRDAVKSAFNSAGQRCSAARVLFLQQDIADRIIKTLIGAMHELTIGDPAKLETDIGPMISKDARQKIIQHYTRLKQQARMVYQCQPNHNHNSGWYVAPVLMEIDRLDQLCEETFGPVLHIIRYPQNDMERVIREINQSGYGLTLSVHSRLDSVVENIRKHARVGNLYVNRNQIGAVVGSQPFGGERLSGTGPKAGGPHYLLRFATERTISNNTTAAAGNRALLNISK